MDTTRVSVRLADGKEYDFNNVKHVGIAEPGIFVLINGRGEQMAQFPIMHTAAIVQPDRDSPIVIASGLVVPQS
jgi:hypothetical protein